MSPLDQLARDVGAIGHGSLMVVTGAGISLASGIPTYRGSDPGAVWKRDVTELATRRFFERDPAASWRWYLTRFDSLGRARPNPAHEALVDLERWHAERAGRFLLVTQNIDTLHEQAGSERLLKVHGSSDRVRCAREGCVNGAPRGSLPRERADMEPFRGDPAVRNLPRCPACRGLLRPHVLWFDEFYLEHEDYGFQCVERFTCEVDLVLFVGTSFSVGVTELVLQGAAMRGAVAYSIDPAAPPGLPGRVRHLALRAEAALPALCESLGARAARPPAARPRGRA